jgi:hypothetical protein
VITGAAGGGAALMTNSGQLGSVNCALRKRTGGWRSACEPSCDHWDGSELFSKQQPGGVLAQGLEHESAGHVSLNSLWVEDEYGQLGGVAADGGFLRARHADSVAHSPHLPLGADHVGVVDVRAGQVLQVVVTVEAGAILANLHEPWPGPPRAAWQW